MDDSTLIASSKSGIEDRLSITAEFYTLNNVQANSAKYVLLSSFSPSSQIIFDLSPSSLVTEFSLFLSSLALNTSFRFLEVWFSLSASPQFVLKQARSMVKDMAALLGPKKLLAQHVAYLYNVALLLRLEFRFQTALFSENTVQSIITPMFSVLRRKAGLAATTPLVLLFLKLPFSIQNAFYRFLSSPKDFHSSRFSCVCQLCYFIFSRVFGRGELPDYYQLRAVVTSCLFTDSYFI
ncbi:hypothetical protein RirG_144200 [Rhizophagus irregularis DAOM 197198w]|uniref:Uncharacterized protein n=1 Tax=Rhizophagus irregularis (strain DAOM 197198w) TaxID=1432141 RepID=A0A015JBI9_RHIIW|nr:hypothetical protein RirG_144200 [Rhizophagus irregularis DAOM 197198w]